MKKRRYERSGSFLIDTFEEAPGRVIQHQLPVDFIDESVSPTDNQKPARAEVDPSLVSTAVATGEVDNDEHGDSRKMVSKNHLREPTQAMKRVTSKTARAAALTAFVQANPAELADLAVALGAIGGSQAKTVLRQRMRELTDHPRTFRPANFANAYAMSLCAVAGELLGLDPCAADATKALLRLLEHPNAINRRSAGYAIVRSYRGHPQTLAMKMIQEKAREMFDIEDEALFAIISPILPEVYFELASNRLVRALECDDFLVREIAAHSISQFRQPNTAKALSLLIQWLPTGQPISLAMWVAGTVFPLADTRVLSDIARRGFESDSPTIRLQALGLVEKMTHTPSVADLIKEALADEPEPILARKMKATISQIES